MSARTKIQKSLGIGAYAPVVFTPSATGEHIKHAVETLGLTGVTICGECVQQNAVTADAPQPKPQPAPLPKEFINVQETNGIWFVDWVNPRWIETLDRKPTRRSALSFARSRALRLGLTIHEGPFVWEPAKQTPTRNFGFTDSQLEWGDRECDERRGT